MLIAIAPAHTAHASASTPADTTTLTARSGGQDSLNWAGYVDAPATGRVTAVTGSFTVPHLSSDLPPGMTSTWIGIGGSTTGDLIQAGVEEDTAGTPVTGDAYRAWYELLPASQSPIEHCQTDPTCTVHPGDHIRVDIHTVAAQRWQITIADNGHWRWQTTVTYLSSGSSAEWIAEATSIIAVPTLYAHVQPVTFDHGHYTVTGTDTHTIRGGHPTTTAIQPAGAPASEATPSALDTDGDGFNVCAYTTRCPAPRR